MAATSSVSALQAARLAYIPALPIALAGKTRLTSGEVALPAVDVEKLSAMFPKTSGKPRVRLEPVESADSSAAGGGAAASSAGTAAKPLRVGCILSGGQASGGHNVISGLFDSIKAVHPDSILYGFLDGPKGLFTGKYKEIDAPLMARYRNMGGFDIIGSGRDKIETPEQFAGSKEVAEKLGLDGLIVIGGDDSNTNAAVLAEYFAANGCATHVIGCPKTIDGDLKIPGDVDISFGFDTACKIYSESLSSVAMDALSSGKYYWFARVMGRAASNIALECALQTHPNVCLIGEEVAARKQNLSSIAEEIVHVIVERAALGKHHGVILVPEGLIEFVPEVNALLSELNDILAGGAEPNVATIGDSLSANNAALFAYLPESIRRQLLADRDPHGNVQVSLIETEKLLAELVAHELERLKRAGVYSGTFTYQSIFLGYEARCGLPTDFDTTYCYALGYNAGALIQHGQTGLMSSVTGLDKPVEQWTCGGVPLVSFMNLERRKGKDKPVIKKWLVDLHGLPFRTFAEHRHKWAITDSYRCPGPIQLDTTGKKQKKADGTHVGPLCFTLALELQERAAHAAAGSSPTAAAGGAGASAGVVADAGAKYNALLEGILTDGAEGVTLRDLHRLEVYRAAHGISDADHIAACEKFGLSRKEWAALLSKLRKDVGAASPKVTA